MAVFRLKALRTEKRLSQKELAEKSGISQNLIARIESGEIKNTSIATLKALADVLGCDASDIFMFE